MLKSLSWRTRRGAFLALALALVVAGFAETAPEPGRLDWRAREDRGDASFRDWPLSHLLTVIAGRTKWDVYVEPGVEHTQSANFKGLSTSEALRRLMGSLSFALVPKANGPVRLYVFRSTMQAATGLATAEIKRRFG